MKKPSTWQAPGVAPWCLLGAAVLAACAPPVPAEAQENRDRPSADGPDRAPSVQSLAEEFRTRHGVPELVVALLGPDGVQSVALGGADGATLFEIGSVTKAFTGLLLAEMAIRGDLDPDDLLVRHLVGDPSQNPGLGEIRLHQLATHTSGLPRLPPDLSPVSLLDPYADYDAVRLGSLLSGIQPSRGAGESYEYSNLGAGVLGHALAHRGDAALSGLIRDRLVVPLELERTGFPDDVPAGTRIARPHAGAEEVPGWQFNALGGAGGMWSTAEDLLRFLAAQLAPPTAPIGDAIRLAQQEWATGPGNVRLGLGWHILRFPAVGKVYFHNGGTGGSRAFMAFAPDAGTAALVLANRNVDLGAVDALGIQLLLLGPSGGTHPSPTTSTER
jgi:serine-type D-Ala-D-Ala carboxypeptidase/endopeptidase